MVVEEEAPRRSETGVNPTVDLFEYRCRCPCLCFRACHSEMSGLSAPAGQILSPWCLLFFASFPGHPDHKLTATCWQLSCFDCIRLLTASVDSAWVISSSYWEHPRPVVVAAFGLLLSSLLPLWR